MKDGAGTDPFADTDSEETPEPETVSTESVDVETKGTSIPWYFRRQTVSDGRDAVKQLELRHDTLEGLDDAVGDLAGLVGLSQRDNAFYTTDAREAILRAGMQNLDDAAEELRDWGYAQVEPSNGGDA